MVGPNGSAEELETVEEFPCVLEEFFFAGRRVLLLEVTPRVVPFTSSVSPSMNPEMDVARNEWSTWIGREGKKATKAQHFEFASYLLKKYNLWGLPATYWQTFELPPLPPSP